MSQQPGSIATNGGDAVLDPPPAFSPMVAGVVRRALAFVALALAGLAACRVYLLFVRWDPVPELGLTRLLDGTASKPFITRVLAPLIIRGTMALTGWPAERAAEALAYVSFVAWLLAMWYLAGAVMSQRAAFVAALLAAGPLVLLFIPGAYTYDMPTLALMTLAFALLARRYWIAYLALFPIVVLCRETSALLILVYWIWARRRLSAGRFIAGLGLQVLVFVAIRGALAYVYRANAGGLFETHWSEHWDWFNKHPNITILALMVYGLAVATALIRWPDQPEILRAAAVIIPIMFVAYWIFGFPGEVRAVVEAYPPLYLLAFDTVWRSGVVPAVGAVRARAPWPGLADAKTARQPAEAPPGRRVE